MARVHPCQLSMSGPEPPATKELERPQKAVAASQASRWGALLLPHLQPVSLSQESKQHTGACAKAKQQQGNTRLSFRHPVLELHVVSDCWDMLR